MNILLNTTFYLIYAMISVWLFCAFVGVLPPESQIFLPKVLSLSAFCAVIHLIARWGVLSAPQRPFRKADYRDPSENYSRVINKAQSQRLDVISSMQGTAA